MFGKKKTADVWSDEDYYMKELLDRLCEHTRMMRTYCREIIICKGSAEMLPDGPDRNKELQEVETYQKRILNLIAAYDDDLRQYNQINNDLLVHFTGKAKRLTSHEELHVAWEVAYREVMCR